MAKRLRGVDPILRFNQKYVIDEETGCWNWIASKISTGYGRFKVNRKWTGAHRFSYEYFIGPLEYGLVVCHNCNNPSCVNPEHLRQDTLLSNSIDMVNAKRQGNQILSVEEVIQIKKELKHPYLGQQRDLAHFFKVSIVAINNIKQGKRWSHIEVD